MNFEHYRLAEMLGRKSVFAIDTGTWILRNNTIPIVINYKGSSAGSWLGVASDVITFYHGATFAAKAADATDWTNGQIDCTAAANDTYGELMIINAAFFVEKEKEPDFDRQVQLLDEKYCQEVTFKYVGPLPPFNFVNISINTEDY